MMDHPNIARVLDAGETDDGTPYFVMELVQGIPITDYCDRNRLTVSERLALFSDVCQAIQHAHQKAIIHRDLKPSNVLVCIYDGQAVPKVIDFGLAKALRHESRLTDKTVFTEFGQVVGTLQYMSPEQATLDALDIDTRTDIYSLGVLLYELLAGSPPIDAETLKNHALLKVLELIRDQEPPRPSQRLGESDELLQTVSAERRIAPVELQRALRGDLDWIVMKTLEKDRTRRYGSASQLADDVGRFLQGEAIDARPPSVLYRARKFVSRNRGSVAATAALAGVLLLGVIGTSVGLMRAKQANEQLTSALAEVTAERDRADEEAAWSFRVASGLANVFQTDTQKQEFADEWSARLASLREEVGPTHESVVRQRALHAVWGWTSVWAELGAAGRLGADEQNMIYDRLKRWGPLVEEAYHAARGVLPVSDPLWTGLLNDQIQWVLMRRGEAPSLQTRFGLRRRPHRRQVRPGGAVVRRADRVHGGDSRREFRHGHANERRGDRRLPASQPAKKGGRGDAALPSGATRRRQSNPVARRASRVRSSTPSTRPRPPTKKPTRDSSGCTTWTRRRSFARARPAGRWPTTS